MGSTATESQTAKKCYKNQTAGWLGVVKLDHLGAQRGHSIEPLGTVWLTDEEAILTARAPALAKDNPFLPQMFQFYDEDKNIVDQEMRPLVLVEAGGDMPSEADRFVPGMDPEGDLSEAASEHDVNLDAVGAAQRDTQRVLDEASDREVPTEASEPVLVPASVAAVPPEHATAAPAAEEDDEEDKPSWVDNPERTAEPQSGALAGSDDPAPAAPEGEQPAPQAQAPTQPPMQQTPASADVPSQKTVPSESAGVAEGAGSPSEQAGEEHAGVTASGEETGAAQTPTGEAPEGEFASHEEVGSPDAPTQGAS